MRKAIDGVLAKRRNLEANVAEILTIDPQISSSGTTTHSLLAVPAGSLLVLTTQDANFQTNCTVTSTPTLRWAKRADSSANQSGNAEIYSARFTVGGNISVFSNWGSNGISSVVYVIKDAELVPAGASATAVSQSQPSVTLSTTRVNSLLIGVTSDWNAVNGTLRAYRGVITETNYYSVPNVTTGYHYYKAVSTISTTTMGLTAPNMTTGGGTCVLEIRSVAPGGPDTTPPSAPVLASGTVTNTTIPISWTASTDDVGLDGYDIYLNNSLLTFTTNTSFLITNLVPSTLYTIFVKAKDLSGNGTNSNTLSITTSANQPGFGTLMYHNGFNVSGDLNSNQLGAGVISTTTKIEGAGSFKSVVPAGSGQISGGWRSEQQYGGNLSPDNQPIVVQYYTLFEIFPNVDGLSCQWHGNTSGTSGQLSLWISGRQFMVQRNTIGTAGSPNIYQGGTLMTIQLNTWYLMRWEIIFTSSNTGYVRLYINNVLYFDTGTTKTSDGSGQYLKVGQNLFASPGNNSTLYVDDLNVWFQ